MTGHFFNYDLESTGFVAKSGDLSAKAIKERGLVIKWTFGENVGIQAPAVVHDGIAYFLEDGPFIHAIKIKNGKAKWSKNIPDDISKQVSNILGFDIVMDRVRSTPVAVGDLLIMSGRNNRQFFNVVRNENDEIVAIGPCGKPTPGAAPDGCSPDQGFNGIGLEKQGGAFVFALDRKKGNVVWATQIDDDRLAVVTGSPILDDKGKTVFFGTSSAQNFINMGLIRFTGLSTDDIDFLLDNGSILPEPVIPYAYTIDGVANPPADGQYLGTDGLIIHDAAFFRGSVVALDTATGHIIFKTYMTPGGIAPDVDGDFSGGAVWGGFTYDKKRKLLYVPTGQNMTVPQFVKDCEIDRRMNSGVPVVGCTNVNEFPEIKVQRLDNHNNAYTVIADNNYPSAIVAIHTEGPNTGSVAWDFTPYPYDTWTNNCAVWSTDTGYSGPNAACVYPVGMDNDFGQAPALVKGKHGAEDKLIAINKTGQVYVLNPDNGQVLMQKGVGVLNTDSSVKLGSIAVDKNTFYMSSALHINFDEEPIPALKAAFDGTHSLCHSYTIPLDYTVAPTEIDETAHCSIPPNTPSEATGSLVSALDLSTLDLVWQYTSPLPSDAQAGVTVVNDLVMTVDRQAAPNGTFRILDKKTGESIWAYSGPNLPNTQPTVSNGVILWTAGYFAADKLYAFELCPKGTKANQDSTKCIKVPK